jgi:hypothetical protein
MDDELLAKYLFDTFRLSLGKISVEAAAGWLFVPESHKQAWRDVASAARLAIVAK